MFANHISNKGPVSRIYKEFLQFNDNSTNNPILKCAKDSDRYFSKENTQMANKHIRKHSPPLVIRETQVKTTMRYHFTPTRMAKLKYRQ